jgi:hypothetical protein
MKAYISCQGDESVGIFSCSTEVDLCIELDYNREEVRKMLKDCFAEIWDDGSTVVTFEDEYDIVEEVCYPPERVPDKVAKQLRERSRKFDGERENWET